MKRLTRAAAMALAVLALVPALALAHPLGNFTINHFAALRVGGGTVALDVVIDRAEIPAFQERQALDSDVDGTVSPAEQENARTTACGELAGHLALTAGDAPLPLTTTAAGLSFPPGAGALPTMRLVCEYAAALPSAPAGGALPITFADNSFSERIGWREIVFDGDLAGVSQRLTAYPQDLLTQPLDVRSVELSAPSAGALADAWSAPDAQPLVSGSDGALAAGESPVAAVPGGIGAELAGIIDAKDLSPAVVLVSFLVAIALGAVHAVSPGHGKTIMAAYLVGTRGTARHAIALGMTVTVSHTLGVLLLALVTLAASTAIPPERLYPVLGVGSGILVVAIGGWLLVGRLRVLRSDRLHAAAHAHGHDHAHSPEHGHAHDHGHSHAPAAGAALSWRGLFALGLSGGLLPSAAALILLLGSIAAGRVAYGLLLVVGFGAGMALVLGGVGLSLVYAARVVERLAIRGQFARSTGLLQMATACVVIVLGVVLTGQALTQVL